MHSTATCLHHLSVSQAPASRWGTTPISSIDIIEVRCCRTGGGGSGRIGRGRSVFSKVVTSTQNSNYQQQQVKYVE